MAESYNSSHPPVHPGEILREDFMKPLGLVHQLAWRSIFTSRPPVSAKSRMSAAVLPPILPFVLARYFKTNPEFWLNLQNFFDLEVERRSGTEGEIERQVHPAAALAS